MFASAEMSWYVEGVIIKYVHVSNHIRWADKQSMANRCNKELLRQYINNSEDTVFAEQYKQTYLSVFEPIRNGLNEARIKANITTHHVNVMLGNQMATHYFTKSHWELPVGKKHINYESIWI